MTNLKDLEAAIRKLLPDTMERVWRFDPVDFVDFRSHAMGVPAHFEYWLIKLTEMNAAIRLWEQGIKPGGEGKTEVRVYENRPLDLADVLRAIEKWYWDNPMAHDAGWEWYVTYLIRLWTLTQPLSAQSQEVIDFLGEILIPTP